MRGTVGLPGERVPQLVPDQRLQVVVEVGDQHLGRRDSGRHRAVIVVDEFDDAAVRGHGDDRIVGRAGTDQTLRGGVRVGDRRAERVPDRGPELRQQRLRGGVHHPRRDREAAGVLLDGQPGEHARVAEEALRLQPVQLADEIGERQGDGNLREPDRAACQDRRDEHRAVHRRWRPHHGEGDRGHPRRVDTQGREPDAEDQAGELRRTGRIVSEDPTVTGASAGRHAQVAAGQRPRFGFRCREAALGRLAVQPRVTAHVVEVGHQLGFRHYREVRQVIQLKSGRFYSGQSPTVESGLAGGYGEQRAQPVSLPVTQLVSTPAQAAEVSRQAGEDVCLNTSAQPVKIGHRIPPRPPAAARSASRAR